MTKKMQLTVDAYNNVLSAYRKTRSKLKTLVKSFEQKKGRWPEIERVGMSAQDPKVFPDGAYFFLELYLEP